MTFRRTLKFLAAPLLIGMLLAGMRTFWIQGLVFPVRVHGDSMAPNFLGQHRQLVCSNCDALFPINVAAPSDHAVTSKCPNCDRWMQTDAADRPTAGQRVIINKRRRPRRWDVVAATHPNRQELVVKRVVGLPGEQIAFHDGDVHVDGSIAPKTLRQFRSMAILVHDQSTTSSASVARWVPDSPMTGWRTDGGSINFDSTNGQDIDWLTYRNFDSFAGADLRQQPIRDGYIYNQSLSRVLHDVSDLLVELEIEPTDVDTLAIRVTGRTHDWILWWHGRRQIARLTRDGDVIQEIATRLPTNTATHIDFAVFDSQVVASIDGRELIKLASTPGGKRSPSSQPVAIGITTGRLRVNRIRISRDVHYVDTTASSRHEYPRLSARQYFLTGDNCPVSEDSRDKSIGPFDRRRIVGIVTPW